MTRAHGSPSVGKRRGQSGYLCQIEMQTGGLA